ncbi:hypothetical protein BDY19DRAFT_898225 [Irpex rosettiformis]|uniref:Uncharacterized protein n=1 Tax=Irpex rosettiformis TaxID=378272 RepID=A0ACB8TRG3_9APHY|nr:hypothetical protein BDY19DRAFT_898225 [Irpex rosettiformis]
MTDTNQADREDVPRISVDSLADWERIKTSYAEAAMNELEQSYKERKDEASKEIMRGHLRKFIERTFDMAKKNVRVNGRNFEDLDEDEQDGSHPFDEALDRHIWSLSDQSLQWDGEIARKRREKPMEVERLVGELVQAREAVDEEEKEEFARDIEERKRKLDAQVHTEDVEVSEDLQDTARRTFAIVDELVQSIHLQHTRSERFKAVTEEVKALQP